MKFKDNSHQEFYEKYGAKFENSGDRQRQVLFYLIGVSEVTRAHIDEIYNFEEHCIIPEALTAGWQTSSNRALTRLAFDLYHGDPVVPETAESVEDELTMYSVANIFGRLNEWVCFGVEAINCIYR